jgi:hypothetical protein
MHCLLLKLSAGCFKATCFVFSTHGLIYYSHFLLHHTRINSFENITFSLLHNWSTFSIFHNNITTFKFSMNQIKQIMKDTIWLVIIALGSCNATNEIGSFIYYSWLWRFSNELTHGIWKWHQLWMTLMLLTISQLYCHDCNLIVLMEEIWRSPISQSQTLSNKFVWSTPHHRLIEPYWW